MKWKCKTRKTLHKNSAELFISDTWCQQWIWNYFLCTLWTERSFIFKPWQHGCWWNMFPQLPTGKEEIKDSVKYYQIILVILYLNIISFTYRILNFCMGTVKIHFFWGLDFCVFNQDILFWFFSVVNVVKRAFLIWISVLLFGNPVTLLSGLGTTIVTAGVLLYNRV